MLTSQLLRAPGCNHSSTLRFVGMSGNSTRTILSSGATCIELVGTELARAHLGYHAGSAWYPTNTITSGNKTLTGSRLPSPAKGEQPDFSVVPPTREILRTSPAAREAFISEVIASLAFEGMHISWEDADKWLEEVLDEPPVDIAAYQESA